VIGKLVQPLQGWKQMRSLCLYYCWTLSGFF